MLVSVLFNDKRRPAIEDSLLAADFWLYPSPSWYHQSHAKPLRGKPPCQWPHQRLTFNSFTRQALHVSSARCGLFRTFSSRQKPLAVAAPLVALDSLALSPWTFHPVKKISSRFRHFSLNSPKYSSLPPLTIGPP